MMKEAKLNTPLGIAHLKGDANGISQISILHQETASCPSITIPVELQACAAQLQAYFEGKRSYFELSLNPQGTDFQREVWKKLQAIPFGKTISYLDLSKQLGDPKAIRAVAAANAKNPLWIVVPCHRVIGSDGSLTGYAGGLWRKKWLLEHESPALQQRLF